MTLSGADPMKKHILIVEDNHIAQLTEKAILENEGLIVDCAESGELALSLIEKNHYDLILMDLGLPGIDGIETTKTIRAYEAKNKMVSVPIVAVTGNADPSQHKLCTEVGMNAVIVKPLSLANAKSLVSNYLH